MDCHLGGELPPRTGGIDVRGEIRDTSGLRVPYMALAERRGRGRCRSGPAGGRNDR